MRWPWYCTLAVMHQGCKRENLTGYSINRGLHMHIIPSEKADACLWNLTALQASSHFECVSICSLHSTGDTPLSQHCRNAHLTSLASQAGHLSLESFQESVLVSCPGPCWAWPRIWGIYIDQHKGLVVCQYHPTIRKQKLSMLNVQAMALTYR